MPCCYTPCLYLHPSPSHQAALTKPLQGSGRRPRHGGEGKRSPGSCTQQHLAGACADAEPFHTCGSACQRGPRLSMHTTFLLQAPDFSPMSQPFSQSFMTSPPGTGTGNAGPFPRGSHGPLPHGPAFPQRCTCTALTMPIFAATTSLES